MCLTKTHFRPTSLIVWRWFVIFVVLLTNSRNSSPRRIGIAYNLPIIFHPRFFPYKTSLLWASGNPENQTPLYNEPSSFTPPQTNVKLSYIKNVIMSLFLRPLPSSSEFLLHRWYASSMLLHLRFPKFQKHNIGWSNFPHFPISIALHEAVWMCQGFPVCVPVFWSVFSPKPYHRLANKIYEYYFTLTEAPSNWWCKNIKMDHHRHRDDHRSHALPSHCCVLATCFA